MKDGEWILYERTHEKFPTYPKYFVTMVSYYDSDNREGRDAFIRRELCRGTEIEVRQMLEFAVKVNEEELR